MDPLSDACLSLSVKDVDSAQVDIGGSWVIRTPAYSAVTFGTLLLAPMAQASLRPCATQQQQDCVRGGLRLGLQVRKEFR
jgi:hypothetical protein